MAGLEYGPAKKKVSTFRGERRSAEWEETVERCCLFALVWAGWRRTKIPKAGGITKFPFCLL
ncbi:hypothetical protein ACN2CC_09340 [Mesorhizobium muleiense]|uniref:hypothetical protein n=1 Tax=Mesorhizobium muleiense TaxID=1004279 RepID=UPI003AFB5BF7